MTVQDTISKIENARKIIALIRSGAIEFHAVLPTKEPVRPGDIIDVLEEYVYLLNHMKIKTQ